MKFPALLLASLGIGLLLSPAHAQFRPAWFQASDHWGDGKAEYLIYEGKLNRYGVPQPAEVTHIFVRESFAPRTLVKADDWRQRGTYPVLKLNQVIRVETGLYVYQQMHSSFWKTETGDLMKFSLTSNDSCGNAYKVGKRTWKRGFTLTYHTYWEGMTSGIERIARPDDGVFYDELPARVRTVDFDRGNHEFDVPLAASIIHSKHRKTRFDTATVRVLPGEDTHQVEVEHAAGRDLFTLDTAFPHRIQSWKAFDGSELTLKKALKIDYWNYNLPGAKEKALSSMGDQ